MTDQFSLSDQQNEAFNGFKQWFRNAPNSKPHYFIGGYAGTGKTTLIKYVLDWFGDAATESVLILAPTGKAADVLRKKGLPTACTIHSAIYSALSPHAIRIMDLRKILQDPNLDPSEKLERQKELGILVSKGPAFASNNVDFFDKIHLIIVDEFSMVGTKIYEDLIEKKVPILCFGDPAQLPPVKDTRLGFQPDYTMTDIHRQAADNPIIRMAHDVRTGNFLKYGDYGQDCKVIGRGEYSSDLLLTHSQVISWTHDARRKINVRYRIMNKNTDPFPMKDEKLICKRNNNELRIYNGGLYRAASDTVEGDLDKVIDIHNGIEVLKSVPIYPLPFEEYRRVVHRHEHLSWQELQGIEQFDFGYCITGHASQGSEFDSVLVVDETARMKSDLERRQWMYTAVTRASKKLTIYRP